MRIHTPLHVLGSRPVEKEGNPVVRLPGARFGAATVALYSAGRIEIRPHVHRTTGSRLLATSKVKHVHSFWFQ